MATRSLQAFSATTIACGSVALMCLLALTSMPYGYYTFLRWAVCAASTTVGVLLVCSGRSRLALLAWGFAIIYNPVFRVTMDREAWRIFNVVAAAFLGYCAYFVHMKRRQR